MFGSVPESSVSPARIPLISSPCPRKTDGDADKRLAAEGLHVNLRSFLTREWDSRIGLARREGCICLCLRGQQVEPVPPAAAHSD